MTSLVADVGGTNTRVALAENGQAKRETILRYRNAQFGALEEILSQYMQDTSAAAPDVVCVDLAGPVRHGEGQMTNLKWTVTQSALRACTGAQEALIINDLTAHGFALKTAQVTRVHGPEGSQLDTSETALVVNVGTGFNAVPVHPTAHGPIVGPSECGHVGVPCWDETSAALAAKLRAKNGFASLEDVVSGRAMLDLFETIHGQAYGHETNDFLTRAQDAPDGAEGVVVRTMIQTLARATGDLALVHLPFGGIVFVGGLAQALLPFFKMYDFGGGLIDKGRFSDLVSKFQVFTMPDDYAALDGSAEYARLHRKIASR